jgi:serine/threonine-protein kinase
MVASHFVTDGAANGFMPKGVYISFMVLMALGLPLLMGILLGLGRHLPSSFINLPNRGYWLAPERIEATREYLGRQSRTFAGLLVVFMCFVHWQVVQANLVQPPRLPESSFIFGLVLFALATVVWTGAFIAHFRRPRT